MAAIESEAAKLQALVKLKDIAPPQWLTPSPSNSELARSGAKEIFSLLKPYAPKSPFATLLLDGFDAEQVWQQIDMQSNPVLGLLRREVKRFETNPKEIGKGFGDWKRAEKRLKLEKLSKDFDERLHESKEEEEDEDDGERDSENELNGEEGESESENESESEEEEDEVEKKKKTKEKRFEDDFLKMDELEDYLEKDEEREYGLDSSEKMKNEKGKHKDEEEFSEEEDGESDEDDDDELGLFGEGDAEDDEGMENAMYDDFFGPIKKKEVKRKFDLIEGSEDSETDDGEKEKEEDEEGLEGGDDGLKNGKLSRYEKERLKRQAQIAEMERANLKPKNWPMRGEVTAAERPKNSALEVDLDFEHNVRPPPVITEEVTASLEEIIKKRVLEAKFDDVKRPPGLPTKAPRERKELDETKSKKGLGEIYEDEYVQKANPDAAPITFSDELKKEASMIFKKLCVKLDALSHFHFAPKPVIEDMTVQSNLPALAMEEVAPLAVSDAAMLAPEEVYHGKGDFKEEEELTQAERKRRRANKKRKFKAERANRPPKEDKDATASNDGAENAKRTLKRAKDATASSDGGTAKRLRERAQGTSAQ